MNKKSIILEGNNIENLVKEGLDQLNLSREEVEIEIINLSIDPDSYDKRKIKIRMTAKRLLNDEKSDNSNNFIEDYLLEISDDGINAYLVLTPNCFKTKTYEEIISEIKQKIKYGLDEQIVKKMFEDKVVYEKVCIAKGRKPIDEENGFIKYYFDTNKKVKPTIKNDGSVDFKHLNIVNNIKKGDILAEITLPKSGKDGIMVTGEVIKYKKGKIPVLKYGRNINISEDGLFLKSNIDGFVSIQGEKIIVNECLEVQSVDNATGNIDFNGAVRIKDNILTGFEVKAKNDIEVGGVVEGALVSSEGNILVRKGIQGYNRGKLISKQNITSRYIENSIIHCEKDLTAEAIMHSDVYCGGVINAIGQKGLIVGGTYRAREGIIAKTIGSSMSTITTLEIGVDTEKNVKYKEIKDKIKKTDINMNKVNKTILILEQLIKSGNADAQKEEVYRRLLLTKEQLIDQLNELKREQFKIELYTNDLSNVRIKVEHTIYPGVHINIGNSIMFVRDEISHCTIYREEGEIKVGPY